MAAGTKSYAPTDTPPLSTTASALASPCLSAAVTASRSSETRQADATEIPAARKAAVSMGPLASRSWCAPTSASGGTSSRPVAMIATRGRRNARRLVRPVAAAMAICRLPSTEPAATSSPPARAFSPWRMMFAPAGSALTKVTSPAPAERVSSTWTTVSAPGGRLAPVKMRAQVPSVTTGAAGEPAATSPTIGRVTGIRSKSAARTANPSFAERLAGGMSRSASTGTANT